MRISHRLFFFAVIAEAEEDLNTVMLQIKRDADASNWKFRITYLILSLLLVRTIQPIYFLTRTKHSPCTCL